MWIITVYFAFLDWIIIVQFTICITPAVDERCDMELDETDPTVWLRLEAATEEYIQNNTLAFKNLCERLLLNQHDDTSQFHKGKVPGSVWMLDSYHQNST